MVQLLSRVEWENIPNWSVSKILKIEYEGGRFVIMYAITPFYLWCNAMQCNHCHVFTWIWEMCLAWYQQADITGRQMVAGRNVSHWIIKFADYIQPIKLFILNCFLCFLSGWCLTLYIMSSCSQQWWLIYNVQCILDCFPVSVSTEPLYSDDQFPRSYSNPYKLYISYALIVIEKTNPDDKVHYGIEINIYLSIFISLPTKRFKFKRHRRLVFNLNYWIVLATEEKKECLFPCADGKVSYI